MRRLVLALVLSLFAVPLFAQTPTAVLQWQQAADLPTTQSYTYALKFDTFNAAIVPATCVATSATVTTCTTPLVLNFQTPHTITLYVANAAGTANAVMNYVPPASPIPATQLKVIIQITVP
jgi:hypothetical protein